MIQFSQVSKAFGRQQVLVDVTFTVHPGERVGIVGPNGAGKSTMFEILSGAQTPDKGEVSYPSSMRLAYVHQQLHDVASETPLLDYAENALPELQHLQVELEKLENALQQPNADPTGKLLSRLGTLQSEFEHKGGYELKNRAETILSGLGFSVKSFSQPFRNLSGGWKIRAELARNLVAKPDILLLDEPTNYLDTSSVEWLRDFLQHYAGTLLLISHDRYLLNSLTDVTLELLGAHVTRYPGNYDKYIQLREMRHEQLQAQQKNIDHKREQLERFVERFRYKAGKATQAQSKLKMLDRLEDVDVQQVFRKPPKIVLPKAPRAGQEIVRLEDASFSYDGVHRIFDHIDLRIERGEKAAFIGLNGMGKTTLLRILAGKLELTGGKIFRGYNVAMGYQSQDYNETMDPNKTVFETVRACSAERSEGELRNMLGGFGFHGEEVEKTVQVLSGGEKLRLALARLLLRANNFLLLDEPTTHLDIAAREALEEALQKYDGTLCLVSHDITFVRNVATTIFYLTPGKITRYYGNYDYFRQKLAEASAPAAQLVDSSQKNRSINPKERRKEENAVRAQFAADIKKWKEQVEKAEKEVAAADKELGEIFLKLSSNEPGTDYEGLNKRLPVVQRKLDLATEQWENSSRKLENLIQERDKKLNQL